MVPRWAVGCSAPHRSPEDAARLEDGIRPDLRTASLRPSRATSDDRCGSPAASTRRHGRAAPALAESSQARGVEMFDRQYFDNALPDQVSWVGQSVAVKVRLHSGREVDVRRVFAGHEGYVVLEVHPARERLGWEEGMLPDDRWVFDQFTVPYESIDWTKVTTREPAARNRSAGLDGSRDRRDHGFSGEPVASLPTESRCHRLRAHRRSRGFEGRRPPSRRIRLRIREGRRVRAVSVSDRWPTGPRPDRGGR